MKTYNAIKKYGSYVVVAGSAMAFSGASQAAILAADLVPITTEVTTDLAVVLAFALGLLALILAPQLGFAILKKFAKSSV